MNETTVSGVDLKRSLWTTDLDATTTLLSVTQQPLSSGLWVKTLRLHEATLPPNRKTGRPDLTCFITSDQTGTLLWGSFTFMMITLF